MSLNLSPSGSLSSTSAEENGLLKQVQQLTHPEGLYLQAWFSISTRHKTHFRQLRKTHLLSSSSMTHCFYLLCRNVACSLSASELDTKERSSPLICSPLIWEIGAIAQSQQKWHHIQWSVPTHYHRPQEPQERDFAMSSKLFSRTRSPCDPSQNPECHVIWYELR